MNFYHILKEIKQEQELSTSTFCCTPDFGKHKKNLVGNPHHTYHILNQDWKPLHLQTTGEDCN